jgi:hypothetical protein
MKTFEGMGYHKHTEFFGKDNDFCLYAGRMHTVDHQDPNIVARGILKLGRGKALNPIQRGRGQGGSNFKVYGKIQLHNNDDTWIGERTIKKICHHRNVPGDEGQMELYDYKDEEIKDVILEISCSLRFDSDIDIVSSMLFYNDTDEPEIIFGANESHETWSNRYRFTNNSLKQILSEVAS